MKINAACILSGKRFSFLSDPATTFVMYAKLNIVTCSVSVLLIKTADGSGSYEGKEPAALICMYLPLQPLTIYEYTPSPF